MQAPKKLWALGLLLVAVVLLYMFTFTGSRPDFVLPRRGYKIAAMLLVSCAVAYSSVVFQTISANRILTPSIMGFDSFFLLIQAMLVFSYGDRTFEVLNSEVNFLISVVGMLLFAVLMYLTVFRKENKSIYLLLLVGLIVGTLFRSLTSFVVLLLDPNEFQVLQSSMFASFEHINVQLLGMSAVVLGAAMLYGSRFFAELDVLNLGRENAISLGVNYNRLIRQNLMLIAVMVAVSTALVGPIIFLGILVANLSYELLKSGRHAVVIAGCCMLTGITVVGGQYLVEHLFNMSTTVSIIINFVGGIYFIFLLLKSNQS
ncbi:MAG: iron ABC transporter permease [Chryseobacterium sp.]|nr:MAG: iron ABC transporter permease [Chryseobacterium sp.]